MLRTILAERGERGGAVGNDGAEETGFGWGEGGGLMIYRILEDRHYRIISTPKEARPRLKRSGGLMRDTNSGCDLTAYQHNVKKVFFRRLLGRQRSGGQKAWAGA